jgi:hypothetical protein
MEPIVGKGTEAVAAAISGRAVQFALQGRFKKTLIWSVPVVMAGVLIWTMRRR